MCVFFSVWGLGLVIELVSSRCFKKVGVGGGGGSEDGGGGLVLGIVGGVVRD